MKHEPQFSPAEETRGQGAQEAKELAACYARLFMGSDDGQRVLADLRRKFGVHRLVFHKGANGAFDAISAALSEGERRVLSEIEGALAAGAPLRLADSPSA